MSLHKAMGNRAWDLPKAMGNRIVVVKVQELRGHA